MHLHGCIVNLYTALVQWTCMELHGIQVCGVECHALVVNSVHFSSALKTTPSSSGWSRHAPSLQNEITFFPVRCMAFTFQSHEISQVFDAPEFESHDICEVFLRGWVSTSRNSSPTLFARFSRNSSPTIFAMVSTSRNSSPTILARVSNSGMFESHDICEVFPEFESHDICEVFNEKGQKHPRVFTRAEVRYHVICGVFKRPNVRYHAICGVFMHPDVRYRAICGVFKRPDVRYHAICGVFMRPGRPRRTTSLLQKVDFPATEAPRVRGVLCVYYKSRLSSHGSSGGVRVYYKTRLSSHGSSGCPGVLRLYYKSRLSSHGSSGCPRRTTFVLQKSTFQPRKLRGRPWRTTFVRQNSIFQPRKSPAYCVCTTEVEKNTQQHYGFSTATTRKPAEGLRLHVKKRKNTTVLAPRQCRNPQRGYVCMSGNAKTRRFWHRANAETRRGCPRARKKVPNTTVLAPRPGDQPQRVVRANQET